MAEYLVPASYVGEGVVGLLKEGGSSRRDAVARAAEALGGSLDSMYYAFGDTDAFVIVSSSRFVIKTIWKQSYLAG